MRQPTVTEASTTIHTTREHADYARALDSLLSEHHLPAQPSFVDGSAFVLQSGSGTPVLFVHGTPATCGECADQERDAWAQQAGWCAELHRAGHALGAVECEPERPQAAEEAAGEDDAVQAERVQDGLEESHGVGAQVGDAVVVEGGGQAVAGPVDQMSSHVVQSGQQRDEHGGQGSASGHSPTRSPAPPRASPS